MERNNTQKEIDGQYSFIDVLNDNIDTDDNGYGDCDTSCLEDLQAELRVE